MARRKPASFKGLLNIGHWLIVHWPTARNWSPSGGSPVSAPFCPAPLFVRLPIGRLETFRPSVGPARTCLSHRLFVLAIEQQNDPLISFDVGGEWCAIDKEAHGRAICVAVVVGEQHRLLRRVGFAPCAVREKAIVAV